MPVANIKLPTPRLLDHTFKDCTKRRSLSHRPLDKLEALGDELRDVFVFVLQLAKSKGNIVPLPFRIAARKASSQFLRKLFSMFIL